MIDTESGTVTLLVVGKTVCYRAFCACYGVTFYRFYNIRSMLLAGGSHALDLKHGNYYRLYSHPKHDYIVRWLNYFIKNFCEEMPHLKVTYLPAIIDKVELYELCVKELERLYELGMDELPSYTYFSKTMAVQFPLLRQPRDHQLGRCFECVKLDDMLRGEKDIKKREIIRSQKKEHLTRIMAQRSHYDAIREQAARNPETVTSIVFDHASGMRIPHHHLHPKSWNNLVRAKTSIFGLIDHGNKCKLLRPYMDIFPHDSNLTNTLLVDYVMEVTGRQDLKVGETIHCQVDNATKENKNRYLFGTCGLIVKEKLFKKLELEMIEPGHTHTDIDALFRFLTLMRKRLSSLTWTHFVSTFLPACFKHHRCQPQVSPVDFVFDVKAFLETYLLDLENFTKYRAFQFIV